MSFWLGENSAARAGVDPRRIQAAFWYAVPVGDAALRLITGKYE